MVIGKWIEINRRHRSFGAFFTMAVSMIGFSIFSPAQALASPPQRDSKPSQIFAYDSAVPFDLKETATTDQDGAIVKDVNYAAYASRHGRIKAFLVRPRGAGPFAGVVFFHWLGKPKGDRTQFLDEAVALSKQGVISLLIQGYFPWTEQPTDGPSDRQRIIDQTIEVRRALDLLLLQKGVDQKRVAFVGHDYGSMFGALAAGSERRVRTWVLIAGLGNFSDWSLKYWPVTAKGGNETYRRAVGDLDPMRHVSHAAPATLLFQFAETDHYITREAATTYFAEASQPKQVNWYKAEHDMNVEVARSDRREWLTKELRLPPR